MPIIPEFPGYYITEDGRVFKGPQEKKPFIHWNGRLMMMLRKDKRYFCRQVSRLVAETYIPNPKGYPWVMHLDDNVLNNHYTNLKWGTPTENNRDTVIKGRWKGNEKYNDEDAQWILELRTKKYTWEEISDMVDISISQCRRIYLKHLTTKTIKK